MRVKPSARPKKRYIVFEANAMQGYAKPLIGQQLHALVTRAFGKAHADLKMKILYDKFEEGGKRGIVRVNNRYSRSMINLLNGSGAFKTLGMSGILRIAERKFLYSEKQKR